jgi:hypothetical protein
MSGTFLPSRYYSKQKQVKEKRAAAEIISFEIERLATTYYVSLPEEKTNEMYDLFDHITKTMKKTGYDGPKVKDLLNKLIDDYGVPIPESELTEAQKTAAKETRTTRDLLIRGLELILIKKQEEERAAMIARQQEALQRMYAARSANPVQGVNIMALRGLRAAKTAKRTPTNLLNFVSVPSKLAAAPVNLLNAPPYTAAQIQENLEGIFNPAAGAPANPSGGRRKNKRSKRARRTRRRS